MSSDNFAQQLVLRLDSMLDVLEARDLGEVSGASLTTGPACIEVPDLDWISPEGDTISVKSNKARYDRQLAVCQACGLQSECLEIAITEGREYGIWGGLMPAERRRYVRGLREAI